MNIINRRRYMGGSKQEYIQDGLIFHLDGINKGTTDANKWVDLINGTEFTGTAVGMDNCFFFDGTTYLANASFALPYNANATVEICYRFRVKANVVIFQSNGNSQGGIWVNPYWRMWMQRVSRYTYNYEANTDYTASFCATQGIQNGSQLTSMGGDWYGAQAGRTCIGGRYYNQIEAAYNGYIYAIRVYNRQLTAEEMLNNQKVDNQRFNLGLTI